MDSQEKDWYSKKKEDVLKLLNTSLDYGLTSQEAEKRIQQYGFNELERKKRATILGLFFSQFKNALLILLLLAGAGSLIHGDLIEGGAIFVIVLLNAILGFVQEFKAEKAIEALEKISSPMCRVLRDGKEEKISAKKIVPGDVLIFEAGDIIMADTRLFEVSSFQVDEASLTGESVPAKKELGVLKKGTHVSDQDNMAFMGTASTYGKAKGIVVSTGMSTELGKIAASIQTTKEAPTPLQNKFSQLAKQIGAIALGLILIVFVSGVLQGKDLQKLILFAVALTVSTIPNSLPIIVTVSLSMGTKRLAKKNMLVKKLPAAESLGAATIICSDKTGTITKNQMTITHLYMDGMDVEVSGRGYKPEGFFHIGKKSVNPKHLELLLRIGYLCNDAKLVKKNNRYEILGDPTEGSLIVLANKGKLHDDYFHRNFIFANELPFDSDRKRMTSIYKNKKNGACEAYVKGAPDILIERCSRYIVNGQIKKMTESDKKKFLEVNEKYAENALRVLGLAYRDVSKVKTCDIENVERDLIFVGLVGMIDPPREEVKLSIERCNQAGIKVLVITGDHAITTKAIARDLGIYKEGDIVLTGEDIEKMSEEELEKKIENVRIIARALPIQKSRIVDALKKNGHVVAMTGDGVNDAPALKKADIGISMGITGTDVAKEVSKATLVDDNFATIVNAIEEGRNIYDKMIQSAKYLLSCNAGEITSVFIAIMMGLPLPLLPLQLLLMNLLTDDFPALGLGFEKSDPDIMKRKPRDPKAKPLTFKILVSIILFGIIMGAGTLFMFNYAKGLNQEINVIGHEVIGDWSFSGSYDEFHTANPLVGDGNDKLIKAKEEVLLGLSRTIAFTTLVLFQMFAVLSSKSLRPSLKKLNPFSNMWLFGAVCLSLLIQVVVIYWAPLQTIFGTVAISGIMWLRIVGMSSLGFIAMEISKFLLYLRE